MQRLKRREILSALLKSTWRNIPRLKRRVEIHAHVEKNDKSSHTDVNASWAQVQCIFLSVTNNKQPRVPWENQSLHFLLRFPGFPNEKNKTHLLLVSHELTISINLCGIFRSHKSRMAKLMK